MSSRNLGAGERAEAELERDPARSDRVIALEARCDHATVHKARRELQAAGVIPALATPQRARRPYPPQPSRVRDAIASLGTSATSRQVAELAGCLTSSAWEALRDARTTPQPLSDSAAACDTLVVTRVCSRCLAPFEPSSRGGSQQMYCSVDCRSAAANEARQHRPHDWQRPPRQYQPRDVELPQRPREIDDEGLRAVLPAHMRAWWTSDDPQDQQKAIEHCRTCAVQLICGEYALKLPEIASQGVVYAGMSPAQLRRARRLGMMHAVITARDNPRA